MSAFTIVSRAGWGARYARGFGPAPLPASEVWLHHSATAAPDLVPPFDDDDAAVRLLERIGQERFGGGISYTFVVTPSGRVYEGHGVDRRGAHTGGRNTISRAICLIGNYQDRAPTMAQLTAVATLLRLGQEKGWWTHARLTGGHRDAPDASTSCPGDAAWKFISSINRAAAREEDTLSEQFEKDARAALLAGLKAGALAALDKDLRGDLHNKQVQLDRIEQRQQRIEAKLDQLLADDPPSRGVPLYGQPASPGGGG